MRNRDDKADGSWGWSRFPHTISRIQREAIDKESRRGPRPDEIRLMKRIEAEAVRERRLHAAAESPLLPSPAQVIKYLTAVQQISA